MHEKNGEVGSRLHTCSPEFPTFGGVVSFQQASFLSVLSVGTAKPAAILEITWRSDVNITSYVVLTVENPDRIDRTQADISGVARAGMPNAEKPPNRAADRSADDPEKSSGHQPDGRGTLAEVLAKIASAMPGGPDQSLARVWGAAQASCVTNPPQADDCSRASGVLVSSFEVIRSIRSRSP